MTGQELVTKKQRASVIQEVISILEEQRDRFQKQRGEKLQASGRVDGPWQSKQPDTMWRLQEEAGTYQDLANRAQECINELQQLQATPSKSEGIAKGSVFIWEVSESGQDAPITEIVIVTELGGGRFGSFFLLSSESPVAQALTTLEGNPLGQTVRHDSLVIEVKELIIC